MLDLYLLNLGINTKPSRLGSVLSHSIIRKLALNQASSGVCGSRWSRLYSTSIPRRSLGSLKQTDTSNTVDSKHKNNKILSNSTDLVVWGTNLVSLVGSGKPSVLEREMVKLPPFQYSIIVGLLLSDGWLTIASSTSINARLGFKQSLARSIYVLFLFNLLSHYCNTLPCLTSSIRKGNRLYGLQFFTRSLPCFTELHSLFYVNRVKVIPKNIYELLTPVAGRKGPFNNGGWSISK